MKQVFYNLQINTNGQKLYEFTDKIIDWINKNNLINQFEHQGLRFLALLKMH